MSNLFYCLSRLASITSVLIFEVSMEKKIARIGIQQSALSWQLGQNHFHCFKVLFY
jgi:hypothetical protein